MSKPRKKALIEIPEDRPLPSAVPLPGTGYPFWRIKAVAPGKTLRVISLMDRPVCSNWHYVSGRYFPCQEDLGTKCIFHNADSPRVVYQGLLCCIDVTVPGERALLKITKGALERTPELTKGPSLYGRVLTVRRETGHQNSPMHVSVDSKVHWDRETTIPVTPDELWTTVGNIWGFEIRRKKSAEQGAPEGPTMFSL